MPKTIPSHVKAYAFVIYSRKDECFLRQLLDVVHRERSICQIAETKCDVGLQGGSAWENQIKEWLTTADLVIFLVSPDFDQSIYVTQTELPLARAVIASGQARACTVRVQGHTSAHHLPQGRTVDLEAPDLRCQFKFAYYEAFELHNHPRRGGLPLQWYHDSHGEKPSYTPKDFYRALLGGLINAVAGWLIQRRFPGGVIGFHQILVFATLVSASGACIGVLFQSSFACQSARTDGDKGGAAGLIPVALLMMAFGVAISLLMGPIYAGAAWLIAHRFGSFGAAVLAFFACLLPLLNFSNRFNPTRLLIYWELKNCKLQPEHGWLIDR